MSLTMSLAYDNWLDNRADEHDDDCKCPDCYQESETGHEAVYGGGLALDWNYDPFDDADRPFIVDYARTWFCWTWRGVSK